MEKWEQLQAANAQGWIAMEAWEALPTSIALEIPFQPGSPWFCDLAPVLKSEACIEGLNLVHINFLFNSISFQGHKPYPGDQKCSLAS